MNIAQKIIEAHKLKFGSLPPLQQCSVSGSALFQGDCLDIMPLIPDNSIDKIFTDLPYGVTNCKWDIVIPFNILWEQYKRIIKPNGVICLFGTEPFSSKMRLSNFDMFKYDWIWYKNQPSNFANAKRMPMSIYEILSVFYEKQPTYNNIKEPRDTTDESRNRYKYKMSLGTGTAKHTKIKNVRPIVNDINNRNATNLKYFKTVPNAKKLHTSEKPLEMLEYFIQTYTNENDIVLDSCMGVGSTGVACKNLNRKFIGIEKEAKYYDIACRRCGF
jgi:site-specific DNA-methyltransferase (adenine-specific)